MDLRLESSNLELGGRELLLHRNARGGNRRHRLGSIASACRDALVALPGNHLLGLLKECEGQAACVHPDVTARCLREAVRRADLFADLGAVRRSHDPADIWNA